MPSRRRVVSDSRLGAFLERTGSGRRSHPTDSQAARRELPKVVATAGFSARISCMKTQPEFISLFSGGGGLDLGFEMAGWKCLYASDIDKSSVETLIKNQGKKIAGISALDGAVIERADVRETTGKEILSKIGRKRGEVPVLVGGPPCQSWSSAGHQLGFEDPRGRLFRDFIRLADELGVRWVVFENVRGLLTARGPDGRPGSALEHIRKSMLDAGFQTEVELLNAADFGIPQRRVRLCVIGYRAGDPPPFPVPTHSKDPALGLRSWMSMGRCLSKLRPPADDEIIRANPKLHEQLSALTPGTGVKSPGKSETTRPGGHWGYKQGAFLADLDLPARTVTASAQQDWVMDPTLGLRRLHPRECAALQTFPATWAFAGARTDQYRQIGNAVPPALAREIASALLEHIHTVKSPALRPQVIGDLVPLRRHLMAAIHYTVRDQHRNGESRRLSPSKKKIRVVETA